MNTIPSFLDFLHRSPTSFHAVQTLAQHLSAAGFTQLFEEEEWSLKPEQGYFIIRDDSLLAAFRIPRHSIRKAILLASHVDSPCLKIKPHPETCTRGIERLGTEVYGAPLLHSWMDRDLQISGRVLFSPEPGKVVAKIVTLEETAILPQVAIHLDRQINEKGAIFNKHDHFKPVFSLGPQQNSFLSCLRRQCENQEPLAFDLFLIPAQKASLVGSKSEMVAGYRLDNLTSVYASLQALSHSHAQKETLQASFFWDHEEIGSMSALGADSRFADEMLRRIFLSLQISEEKGFQIKSRSCCLSVDVVHGFHPGFAEKTDAENTPLLGQGPVLKSNAGQKYVTNASLAAKIILSAKKKNIPLQRYAARSDIPSGSTVGPMMAAQLGIATLDLGICTWAMHSARETISATDQQLLADLLRAAMDEAEI